jgi:RNA polymerase sigma factor (TIGR02999 family)
VAEGVVHRLSASESSSPNLPFRRRSGEPGSRVGPVGNAHGFSAIFVAFFEWHLHTPPMDAPEADIDELNELRSGRRDTLDGLIPVVYEQLRRIARRHLASRKQEVTLSTTGLIHEAYLKLVDQSRVAWTDRAHFFALASVAMRHVLVDRAKARLAFKRGGAQQRTTLENLAHSGDEQADTVLDINDALDRLARVEPRLVRVVECRFFGGLSEEETAEALGITTRTVQRDWAKARMLLRRALSA